MTADPLSIRVFAAYYPPHCGGYERVVSELAERLAHDGHDVLVVTCDLGLAPQREQRNGVRIVRVPSWRLLGGTYVVPKPAFATWRLIRSAMAGRVDLVHTHTRFFPTSALGLVCAWLTHVPLVHTEHGAGHSALASFFVRAVNRIVDHTVGRLIMHRASVVAISSAAAAFCRHLGARDVAVIPDGVDLRMFRPGPSGFRALHNIGDGDVVIAFVGRLVYGKGVQDLLAAWPRTMLTGWPLRLVVVGDGPLRDQLECQSREFAQSVIFTGSLPTSGVVEVLNAADIFVSPTYTEGLGLSIIEAGAVGLPAVASRIEGVLDVVEHGRTGLLVPPGDVDALAHALAQLVTDDTLRRSLGAAARTVVRERFDWRRTAAQYEEIFTGFARRRGRVAAPIAEEA